MHRLKIKALSVNKAWKGRRFKTKEYEAFEAMVFNKLPLTDIKISEMGKLKVVFRFGLSSKSADGDNCIKMFQDILSKFYGFNDKNIYRWEVDKVDTKKGDEFIEFDILCL